MTYLFLDTKKQKNTLPLSEICCSFLQKCKFYLVLALLLMGVGNVWGQTTIFTESIGTCCASTNTAISSTTFDNSGLTFSGTADTRTTGASTGYTGASGGRNVFITNTVGRDFMISGINTTGYSTITLSFGHFKSTTASNNELAVEFSSDGTNWTALSYSRATGTGTANWILITPTGSIPATANLRIRFRQTSTSPQFRVDDIKLVGTASTNTPSAPTITTITPGNGQLSVAFTTPSSNGGAVITNYAYSTNNGSTYTALSTPSTTSPIVISGLTNNTTYDVKIRAINSVGNGAESNMVQGTPTNAILLTALGTAATEDFNAMGANTTLPLGCKMHASTSSPTWSGASLSVTRQASSGSPLAGGTYNWGSSGSERAIGAMTSGNFASPNNLLVKTRNTTGSVIENIFISYNAERYRENTAAASIDFFYSLDGTAWTAVSAGDVPTTDFPTGSSAYSFSPPLQIPKSFVISGLNIANNTDFYLRWELNTTGSNSQGIAIDDISIKPCGTVAAPTATAQSFCSGATIADLTATGTAIQWYAASSGGAPLSTSTALANNTTYYASQTISGCESVSRTEVTVTFKATHTWVGASPGNWNTAANWCGGVPNSTSASVTIPSGTTVTLNTNASVAQLTIASGGTITVSGTSQLTVASGGTFTNNGTFTAGTGTLIFAGSGTLAGSATTLNHLTLNGALTRSATTTVNGTLSMNTNASLSAALQFGSTSTLVYNVSGSFTVSNNEWPVSSGPFNVTIQNNALVSLNGNKAINGTLTLTSGKIILGNHSLIANAFSGGSSSSYVITDGSGRLQTNVTSSAVVLPVGPDASNYNPVTITNNTGTADDFAVLVFEEITEEGTRNGTRRAAPNRVNLTWDIDKLTNQSANAGDGVDFAFSWKDSQLIGSIQSSRFRLYHHDGSSWDPQMGTPSVSQNSGISTLEYTEYKGSFSPFAIGDDVQLLPVLWGNTSLKYLVDKKSALLEWSTLFEENTAKFEVERSENGMDWYKIYATKAAGQSFTILEYSFEDMAPVVGNSFYRVMQIDIDGLFAYSNSFPLFIDQTSSTHLPYVFPIPASSIMFIRYDGHTQINCSLLNSVGAEVINSQTVYMNDNNLFDLDVKGIVSGSYLLKIVTKYGVNFVKVLID